MNLDFIGSIIFGFAFDIIRDVVRWLFPAWRPVNERRIEGGQQ